MYYSLGGTAERWNKSDYRARPGLTACLLALQVIVWVEGRKGTLIYFTFAAPEKGGTACRKYEL